MSFSHNEDEENIEKYKQKSNNWPLYVIPIIIIIFLLIILNIFWKSLREIFNISTGSLIGTTLFLVIILVVLIMFASGIIS